MAAPSRSLSLRCTRCGGWLEQRDDPSLLRCGHCALAHLQLDEAAVGVYEPVGRIGRRRAGQIVHRELRQRAVRGASLVSSELHYLPFWQIEGKLVGWHRFRRRIELGKSEGGSGLIVATEARIEEETVSHDVTASIAACDVRSYGLLGIAERAKQFRLRPLSIDSLSKRDGGAVRLAPVLHGSAGALRQVRESRTAQLRRTDATTIARRVALVRARVQLIYYPVWRLGIHHPGGRFSVDLDGLNGNILDGSYARENAGEGRPWLVATATAAFVAGFAWMFGVLALAAWGVHRLRKSHGVRSIDDLSGWMSSELGAPRSEMTELGSTRGSTT